MVLIPMRGCSSTPTVGASARSAPFKSLALTGPRGHIPLPLNSDVGGALGNFTTNERLLDNDPYWIAVTS